jgi:hypothetical protein
MPCYRDVIAIRWHVFRSKRSLRDAVVVVAMPLVCLFVCGLWTSDVIATLPVLYSRLQVPVQAWYKKYANVQHS